jgi:hypothetical protein
MDPDGKSIDEKINEALKSAKLLHKQSQALVMSYEDVLLNCQAVQDTYEGLMKRLRA